MTRTDICRERWFQIAEKGWRPAQGWGFCLAAVFYGFRPVIGLSFSIEIFAALAAASGAGFITRAVEKYKRAK